MSGSVIVSGARTPIGRLSGSLAGLSAVELGATAIAEALARGGLLPEAADMVIMGQVLQAGQGQNPARQAAVRAGVPTHVSALTVNKVCLSGLEAVHIADLMIRAGEAEVVVAGGMESMTLAPYVLPGGRAGLRFGDQPLPRRHHDGRSYVRFRLARDGGVDRPLCEQGTYRTARAGRRRRYVPQAGERCCTGGPP